MKLKKVFYGLKNNWQKKKNFDKIITAIRVVKQGAILLFATSAISVLGIALFAEVSILSNIYACLILFFQHPVKTGDTINMYFEESIVEGKLIDITYFFVDIKMMENHIVTIPDNILLQTPISIFENGKLPKQKLIYCSSNKNSE